MKKPGVTELTPIQDQLFDRMQLTGRRTKGLDNLFKQGRLDDTKCNELLQLGPDDMVYQIDLMESHSIIKNKVK